MKIHSIRRSSGMQRAQGRPRGVVLLFVLIALVIIMVASVALVRSFNTAMFTAGNLAFKRDLLNQGERVVPAVMDMMTTGALASLAARANSAPARNYSATILPTNPQGIPLQLLVKDADFTAGVILNDV
ncbi:MAG TPA: hypothetical protein VGP22_12315, partial [Albitalea sp.]|nr:hypothetical protein [Albitalea sp.]